MWIEHRFSVALLIALLFSPRFSSFRSFVRLLSLAWRARIPSTRSYSSSFYNVLQHSMILYILLLNYTERTKQRERQRQSERRMMIKWASLLCAILLDFVAIYNDEQTNLLLKIKKISSNNNSTEAGAALANENVLALFLSWTPFALASTRLHTHVKS